MEKIRRLQTSKQKLRTCHQLDPQKVILKAALIFFLKKVNTDGRSEMNKGVRSKESAKYVLNCK